MSELRTGSFSLTEPTPPIPKGLGSKISVFIGIEACAQRKRLPICFAARQGKRLGPLHLPVELSRQFPRGPGNREVSINHPFKGLAAAVTNAIDRVIETQNWNVMRVAVDAPAAPPSAGERLAEKTLSEFGLSSFQTPNKKTWAQIFRSCRGHLRRGEALSYLPLDCSMQGRISGAKPGRHRGGPARRSFAASETGWTEIALERALKHSVSGSKHDKLVDRHGLLLFCRCRPPST